jgi:phage-related protein
MRLRIPAPLAALVLGVYLAVVPVAFGQRRGEARHRATARPPDAARLPEIERFSRMPPARQERELEKLPPDRRRRVERQLRRYNQLSPEQRQELRQRYEMFRRLPPERQEALRRAFRDFEQLPPERRRAVRAAFQRLRAMPPAKREARMKSAGFRSRFNKRERKILRELSRAAE